METGTNSDKLGRPFISCHLEAGIAAKYHGIRFYLTGNYEYNELIYDDDTNLWLYQDGVEGISKYPGWSTIDYIIDRFYIHPESLPLLVPVVGDVVEISFSSYAAMPEGSSGVVRTIVRLDSAIDDYIEDNARFNYIGHKIIQRKGKPFPKIEYDND